MSTPPLEWTALELNEALGRKDSTAEINPGRLLGGGGPCGKGCCRAFQARETEAERLEHLAHREGMSYGRVRVQVSLERQVG